MTPSEFWNSTYRQINSYTQSNLCHCMDEFRQQIRLQEEVSNKMILADAMSNRRPKITSLYKTFETVFPEKRAEETQTPEEITRRMREIMKG